MIPPTSIYLHIPFCAHRCAYCDFNTYAGQEGSIPAYVRAMCREIELVGSSAAREQRDLRIHTIFFGGGTPSLLAPAQLAGILDALRRAFRIDEGAEISLEANPGTVSPESLQRLRKMGVNRLSLGVQSANSEELRMLERIHDFPEVIEAVRSARRAGFDNINLDLIYGLP
ncbi:MAG: coproporphyrinogen-III oxidase family protein, partial [Bacteroidota bacterium]